MTRRAAFRAKHASESINHATLQKTGSGGGGTTVSRPAAAPEPGAGAGAGAAAHMSTQRRCQRVSAVSSGWKAVPSSCPCRTATATVLTCVSATFLPSGTTYSASTSTAGPCARMAGARMNTARNGSVLDSLRVQASVRQEQAAHGSQHGATLHRRKRCGRRQVRFEAINLAAKEVAAHGDVQAADECLTALFLACAPLMSTPSVVHSATHNVPTARSARKMRPAQVPQMGRPLAAYSRSAGICGDQRLSCWARSGHALCLCGARLVRTHQTPALSDERHRGALTARDDQAADLG